MNMRNREVELGIRRQNLVMERYATDDVERLAEIKTEIAQIDFELSEIRVDLYMRRAHLEA